MKKKILYIYFYKNVIRNNIFKVTQVILSDLNVFLREQFWKMLIEIAVDWDSCWLTWLLIGMIKACIRYFLTIFLFFHQMIALQKLWKMFFLSSKKLFLFLRYSNFCNFFTSFCQFPYTNRSGIIYDVMNCLV